MRFSTALCTMLTLVTACASKPLGRDNPSDAFARLAPCVDTGSSACVLALLDRDSRWSVHTAHRTLAQTRTLVESSYPGEENIRNSAYGSWSPEARASSPEGMFEIFCKQRGCLRALAGGFGAVEAVQISGDSAVITTTRGGRFPMHKTDGEWGLSTYRDELLAAKLTLLDNLEQVKRNAAEYDEQRLATGEKR